MKSRWVVCMLTLLLGCSEGDDSPGGGGSAGPGVGGSGGAPEIGAGSEYRWFTGSAEDADVFCRTRCGDEDCWYGEYCEEPSEEC